MKQLPAWPAARADKPATAILHDEPSCRIVGFTLTAGQEVAMHSSKSSVVVHVVDGSGAFLGGDDSIDLKTGESAAYAPDERHGMRAGQDGLRFMAVIAPSPTVHG